MKPKSIVTAYHCKACGAVCLPGEKFCRWCRTRYEDDAIESINFCESGVRLLAECGNDFVYFPIKEMTEVRNVPVEIWAERDTFGRVHRTITGLCDLGVTKFEIQYSRKAAEKFQKMVHRRNVNMRVEIGSMNQGYAFTGSFIGLQQTIIPGDENQNKLDVSVLPHDIKGWEQLEDEPPEDLRCPNCGAPIKSRFGCCDYCTGWVEYMKGV